MNSEPSEPKADTNLKAITTTLSFNLYMLAVHAVYNHPE